eukprot:scaffold27484_cov120-Isochrysis_galbana.AAC.2
MMDTSRAASCGSSIRGPWRAHVGGRTRHTCAGRSNGCLGPRMPDAIDLWMAHPGVCTTPYKHTRNRLPQGDMLPLHDKRATLFGDLKGVQIYFLLI